jgi:hypothetical protein
LPQREEESDDNGNGGPLGSPSASCGVEPLGSLPFYTEPPNLARKKGIWAMAAAGVTSSILYRSVYLFSFCASLIFYESLARSGLRDGRMGEDMRG